MTSQTLNSIPETGSPAPDATVSDLTDQAVQLATLWDAAPRGLALVFLRHYGCTYCRMHATDFQQHAADFEAAGIAVALVGCGTVEEAQTFVSDLNLTVPVYNDADRVAYAAYGVGQVTLSGMLHPTNLVSGIKGLRKGFVPHRSAGDPRQLQGQFLIDAAGIVRSVARPAVMGDIPTASALLSDAQSLPEGHE